MSIVFSQLMRRSVGDVPFIAFLLAGIVPFSFFRQCMVSGARSIVQAMSLMNQVYFPREIVVLSTFTEALFDLVVMFGTTLVISAVLGLLPTPHLLALPLLVLIQGMLTFGVMLIVAWLGALIRDVPNLIQLGLQVIFYLSAVIYPRQIVPERYRWILDVNPVVVLINAYRDILVYGRAPDWLSLLYPTALGIGLLIFGYRVFKAHEDTLADLL
jgi:ABC-type polysaccharide/polyol phosphate export permease